MNHIPQYGGREQEISALGKKWKLSSWTIAIMRKWLEWAAGMLPDPLTIAAKNLDKFPAHLQETIVRKALDDAGMALSIGTPKVNALIQSPEGASFLLFLLLQKYQPEVTEEEALQILFAVGMEQAQGNFDRAAGVVTAEGKV